MHWDTIRRTAARQVLVPHGVRVEDVKRARNALGRDIDVTLRIQRRRRHPEHVLAQNPRHHALRDLVEEFAHNREADRVMWGVQRDVRGPAGVLISSSPAIFELSFHKSPRARTGAK